jgi:putative hydrolase of the HAD superfamily
MSAEPAAGGPPDLRHIQTWLFDLDNTLYPAESQFMSLVEARMTLFMQRHTGLPHDEARAIQKRYFHEQGTTLAGLMINDGIDPAAFLDFVHDVPLDRLVPDQPLAAALARLPGRRLIFTNGSAAHAKRVLSHLALDHLFEDVFHIEAADYVPKPSPATFQRMIAAHAVAPAEAAFFEDSEKNLRPAADIGMTTVLVGHHAKDSTAPFVHHRTDDLAGFLAGAALKEIAA